MARLAPEVCRGYGRTGGVGDPGGGGGGAGTGPHDAGAGQAPEGPGPRAEARAAAVPLARPRLVPAASPLTRGPDPDP